jgi:hypothetical protein
MGIWSPKPPPGPLNNTAERVCLALGIAWTILVVVFVVFYTISLGRFVVN